jgi:hypothetical protein
MYRLVLLAIMLVALQNAVLAQDSAVAPVRPLPAEPAVTQQQQRNAASATKDTSATSGDQITKPAGAKDSTLTGCLAGPDKDGKFKLRSMSHREGVQVLGPDDMKNDAGAKVKLTGKWEAPAEANTPGQMRRFQVTDVEVIAKTCTAPSESTPVSKNRKQKATTYDVPSGNTSK